MTIATWESLPQWRRNRTPRPVEPVPQPVVARPAAARRQEIDRLVVTKRTIDVGEPTAFNGSFIDVGPHRLCVFRGSDGRSLHYAFMHPRSQRVSSPAADTGLANNDDPRLVRHAGRVFLSTNYWWGHWLGSRMELRELCIGPDHSVCTCIIGKFDHIDDWPGYVKPQYEKNWAPFSQGRELYYVYSLSPHRVLRVDLDRGRVALAHETPLDDPPWLAQYGRVFRMNAPAVRLADGAFLSTFHTRVGRDYFTGFYRFAGAPPFGVTEMSGVPALWPDQSEGTCWRNQHMRLLFITGMEVNEQADRVLLSGGDNDHSVITVELSLAEVLSTLQPLRQ